MWAGTISINSQPYLDQIIDLRNNHGDVAISFGGENGQELAQVITDVNSLVSAYQSVINTYYLNVLDFDIEGGAISWSAYGTNIDNRNKALAILQQNNPGLKIWYTLPVLPQGLTADGLALVNNAISRGVVFDVHLMTMDFGDDAAPNPANKMGSYCIQAAQSTYNQLESLKFLGKIGIIPMIGINDQTDEIVWQTDIQQILSFCQSTSYINYLGFWCQPRDQYEAAKQTWSSETCSGIPQAQNDFINIAKVFNQ